VWERFCGPQPALRGTQPHWLAMGALALVGVLVLVLSRSESGKSFAQPCARALGDAPHALDMRGASVSFAAIGDWGLDAAPEHEDGPRDDWDALVNAGHAGALGRLASRRAIDWVVSVGDHFYQYGVRSSADARWRTSFSDLFGRPTLPLRWYAMLGNHDYKANLPPRARAAEGVLAQLEHTWSAGNAGAQWCLPSANYTLLARARDFDLALVVFDSQALVRKDPDDAAAYDDEGAPGVVPGAEAQLAWLEAELCGLRDAARARARPLWLLTAAHHFVVSAGSYIRAGVLQEQVMRERVLPLLHRCGVRVHLHGHDHVTQAIELREDAHEGAGGAGATTLQLGVGSAGKTNGDVRDASQATLDALYGPRRFALHLATKTPALALLRATAHELRVELLDQTDVAIFARVLRHG
jgi:tartrate-resistant acid phosphatase type 5